MSEPPQLPLHDPAVIEALQLAHLKQLQCFFGKDKNRYDEGASNVGWDRMWWIQEKVKTNSQSINNAISKRRNISILYDERQLTRQPRIHLVVSESTLHLLSGTHKLNAGQGHSLGGGFATLVWAELNRLRRLQQSAWTVFNCKSLTIFGSPRVASMEMAEGVQKNLYTGQHNWRFVYADPEYGEDVIPSYGPLPGQILLKPFIHLDGGKKITDRKAPVEIASERPNNPLAPLPWRRGFEGVVNRQYGHR
ncbi:hypothetical protein P7C70_g6387, partial [Phenoliferia sp. Uapishka_3]